MEKYDYSWFPACEFIKSTSAQYHNTKIGKNFADYGNLKTLISDKGVYIKYVGGSGGFYKFFQKKFVDQEAIDLNI